MVFAGSYSLFAKMLRDSKMFLNFLVVLQYLVRFIQLNWFSQILEKDITEYPPEIWTQGVFKLGVRSAFILFKSFHACVVSLIPYSLISLF